MIKSFNHCPFCNLHLIDERKFDLWKNEESFTCPTFLSHKYPDSPNHFIFTRYGNLQIAAKNYYCDIKSNKIYVNYRQHIRDVRSDIISPGLYFQYDLTSINPKNILTVFESIIDKFNKIKLIR